MKYSVDHIKRALERKGYKFFESGDYNVNIVGVRNSLTKNKVTNAFDDKKVNAEHIEDILINTKFE